MKRNDLFEKAVANADPSVRKEESDNVDKILASGDVNAAAEEEYPCDKPWMTDSMRDLNAHKQVAFWKGAKWQKEQMIKEAVEGEVSHCATVHYVKTNESQLSARLKQFQEGDKVRIIIVKED